VIDMPESGLMNGGSNIWSSLGSGGTATTRIKLTQQCVNPQISYYQHKSSDETISGSYFILDASGKKLSSTWPRTLCYCKDCWCISDRHMGVTMEADTYYHLGFYNSPGGDMSGPACYADSNARTVGIATFDSPRSANGAGYTLPGSNSAGRGYQCRWRVDCSVNDIEMPFANVRHGGNHIWGKIGSGGTATTRVTLNKDCPNPLIAYQQHKDADETISGSYFIMDNAGSKVLAKTEGKTRCYGKGVWCPDDRFYGVTLKADTPYHLGFLNNPAGDMSGPVCYPDTNTRTVDTTVYSAKFDDPRSTSSNYGTPRLPPNSQYSESCRWKLNCGGVGAVMPYSGLMNGGSNIWSTLGSGGTATTRIKLTQQCVNPLIAYYQHKNADESISGSYFIMDASGKKLGNTKGKTLCFCKDCWCPDARIPITMEPGTYYHLGFYNNPGGDMSGPACYSDSNARTVGIATFDSPRSANGAGYTLPGSNGAGNYQCRWMIDCQADGQGNGYPSYHGR
jgi:hypothetical protein